MYSFLLSPKWTEHDESHQEGADQQSPINVKKNLKSINYTIEIQMILGTKSKSSSSLS